MRKAPVAYDIEDAYLPLIRQHFALFLRFAFRELLGAEPFAEEWHLEAIEYELHRLRLGDNNQLIVTLPPRHLKSITISVAWVAWMLGRDPGTRFTGVSYDLDLAEKNARDCLKIIESDWYRKAFPNMRLTKRAVMDFETYAGGGRLSTSIQGGLTGRGGDWMIVDDPMKGEDALSEVARETVKSWWANTGQTRANTDRVKMIIVMQRLHEDDLAGHLLRQGGWHELRLPSIATCDDRIALTRGRFHYRKEGQVLTPGRQSLVYLRRREAAEPYVFAAQNQQDPIGRIGAFVSPEWFGTYDVEPATGMTIMSCDTAVKTTVRSDWSVAIIARFYQGRFYILDVYRKRVEFGDLMTDIRALGARHNVQRLLIEDASSGASLIQMLNRDLKPHEPYAQGIKPAGDKIQRFEAAASRIQSGQVVLPKTAPWLGDFMKEVTRFPGGSHDDQADALAQLLANPPPVSRSIPNAAPEWIEAGDAQRALDEYDGEWFDPWGAR